MDRPHRASVATDAAAERFRGVGTFLVIFAGEFISSMGSVLSTLALDMWTYQRSGSVEVYSGLHLLSTLPVVLLVPFAGAWMDRLNRRNVLVLGNVALAVISLVLVSLAFTNRLSPWALYWAVPPLTLVRALLAMNFSTLVTQLVPNRSYTRVSGVIRTLYAATGIGLPLAVGFLIASIGIRGILLIDLASTIVSIAAALSVDVPDPPPIQREGAAPSVWRDALDGLSFVRVRPGLFGILTFLAVIAFVRGMGSLLTTPLFLSTMSTAALGAFLSIANLGSLAAGGFVSVFGEPKARRISVILWCFGAAGLSIMLGGFNPTSLVILTMTGVLFEIATTVAGILMDAIWKAKVPTEMQGRTWAIRRTVESMSIPAMLLAGPLTDRVFEPAMRPGGWLAPTVGRVIGLGPGRGIGTMLVGLGLIMVLAAVVAGRNPRITNVDAELPDASH